VANESVNVSLESNKKAAKRGVYQKLSAEKKAEIGKRAAEHGVIATVRYYASKLPEPEKICGRANGTAKFIQQKLCRQLSAKFKFREIKALYGIS